MSEPPQISVRRRAAFAGTLAAAMGVGPFAVHGIGALSPLVVPELGLTRTELGSLATVTFLVAAITSILAGRQVDTLGARGMAIGVFLVGGAAAAAMVGSVSLLWLWAGAALGGVSRAMANAVTNQLIADHIPVGRQGFQIGIKQSGVQMAQAIAGFALPPLALVVGWRLSMLVGVGLALAGLLSVILMLSPATGMPRASEAKGRGGLSAMVWWLAGYTFLISMAVQAVIMYVPLYAFERVELSAAAAGMAAGVLGVVGLTARILWGRIAEWLGVPITTLAVLATIAFVSILLLLAAEHVSTWLLWPGLVGFGASAIGVNAVVMLTVVRGAADGRTGRASGVVGLGLFLGFMTGPLAFGVLVDHTESYLLGWSIMAGLCLLALVFTVLWRFRARGDVDPQTAHHDMGP